MEFVVLIWVFALEIRYRACSSSPTTIFSASYFSVPLTSPWSLSCLAQHKDNGMCLNPTRFLVDGRFEMSDTLAVLLHYLPCSSTNWLVHTQLQKFERAHEIEHWTEFSFAMICLHCVCSWLTDWLSSNRVDFDENGIMDLIAVFRYLRFGIKLLIFWSDCLDRTFKFILLPSGPSLWSCGCTDSLLELASKVVSLTDISWMDSRSLTPSLQTHFQMLSELSVMSSAGAKLQREFVKTTVVSTL
jgi:hypothetical protein